MSSYFIASVSYTALLHPVCKVGRRGFVALRDELLGGTVGEQCLDFRTVMSRKLDLIELSERHASILIRASECLDVFVAIIPVGTLIENGPWQMFHDLSKRKTTG